MCSLGDSSAEAGATCVSAHNVTDRRSRVFGEAMLSQHTPAASTAPQQQKHACLLASASCTGLISNQHSQLGRASRTGTRGARNSIACSRMVADITQAPSAPGASAAAAMATAGTLHCQLWRRKRAPFCSARRKRTTAAQQLCRCLVDATALPLLAPLQKHQPGEMALANVQRRTFKQAANSHGVTHEPPVLECAI